MSIPNQPAAPRTQAALSHQAVVVDIYGLPGLGKTFLLSQLREELAQGPFSFYDGSEVIDSLVSGGLSSFKEIDEKNQVFWRQQAIKLIGKESVHRGHIAVVAGHYMFWSKEEETGHPVWTEEDKATYTHILYLDVPTDVIKQRRQQDTKRKRINNLVNKVSAFLHDFQHHNEEHNLALARAKLDQILAAGSGNLETMLVLDGDKTLAAEDTGSLFWNMISNTRLGSEENPLKAVFSKGYSYTAFRQAMLLYEETMDDEEYNTMCQKVASAVKVHPEFQALLHRTRVNSHVSAVVITCGLRRIWEIVLASYGLSDMVKVLGSGRLADGFVIPTVKGALVSHFQDNYRLFVWAFGDSPLDLIMLSQADQAIVVVGDEQTRSKSMELELAKTIAKGEIRARQTPLPSIAAPRLDTIRLPLVHVTDAEFIDSVFTRRERLKSKTAQKRPSSQIIILK